MASDNMYDLDGWHKVGCHDSDDIRPGMTPVSSLTDLDGQFGSPIVYTEWALAGGTPTLRDYRYPDSDRECEHYESDILVHLRQDDRRQFEDDAHADMRDDIARDEDIDHARASLLDGEGAE